MLGMLALFSCYDCLMHLRTALVVPGVGVRLTSRCLLAVTIRLLLQALFRSFAVIFFLKVNQT